MGVSINTQPSPVLLWKHPNEGSGVNLPAFNPQTISIPNLSDYKAIDIVFCAYNRTRGCSVRCYIASKADNFDVSFAGGSTVSGSYVATQSRSYTINSDSISFAEAYDCRNGIAATTQNLYMIPIRIYGIK